MTESVTVSCAEPGKIQLVLFTVYISGQVSLFVDRIVWHLDR